MDDRRRRQPTAAAKRRRADSMKNGSGALFLLSFVLCCCRSADAFGVAPQHHRHPSRGFVSWQRRTTTTTHHPSALHVITPPDQEQRRIVLDIPNDDDDFDLEENETTTTRTSAAFLDFEDYQDDDIRDDDVESSSSSLDYTINNNDDDLLLTTGMEREEADMLEEREDRMYVDESGTRRKVETCVLVGVQDNAAARRDTNNNNNNNDSAAIPYFTLEESMHEMRELIRTAGLDCVGEITQRLNQVNPRTYVGSGKVLEAKELMEQHPGCCTIVFDAELTPGQQKALENAFNKQVLQNDFLGASGGDDGTIKVIDRTALILDIFAQHAKTREGKLQVDLALHEYRKPRLTRMWTHLERQSGAGGVGLRGPGERQLEIDKRLLRDRIGVLKQKIDDVQKQRTLHRQGRERTGLPILSLVGYTNAGKSSLLNFLTRSGVLAEAMLFATLDPTTRKVKLPGLKTHPEVLLTDTVGFIQKLPTHLVAAFRATLEEVKEANVLVHVIDVSNPTWEKQERAVMTVLRDMGADDKPIVRVLNKMDLLDPQDAEHMRYEAATTDWTVAVSALHGDGMQDFVAVVEEAMASLLVAIEVVIPYSNGDALSTVHEQGNVEVVDYRPEGTYCRALVPKALANRLDCYSVAANTDSRTNDKNDDEIDWVALGRGRHDVTK